MSARVRTQSHAAALPACLRLHGKRRTWDRERKAGWWSQMVLGTFTFTAWVKVHRICVHLLKVWSVDLSLTITFLKAMWEYQYSQIFVRPNQSWMDNFHCIYNLNFFPWYVPWLKLSSGNREWSLPLWIGVWKTDIRQKSTAQTSTLYAYKGQDLPSTRKAWEDKTIESIMRIIFFFHLALTLTRKFVKKGSLFKDSTFSLYVSTRPERSYQLFLHESYLRGMQCLRCLYAFIYIRALQIFEGATWSNMRL